MLKNLTISLILTLFNTTLPESVKIAKQPIEFKLSIQSDTLIIGEPILPKYTFINLSDTAVRIYWPDLLFMFREEDDLETYLISPTGEEWIYDIGRHADVFFESVKRDQTPYTWLPAKDTVYVYDWLKWERFLKRTTGGRRWVKVEELSPGPYKITATINLGTGILKSNKVSFYLLPLLNEDLKVYNMWKKESLTEELLAEIRGTRSTFVKYIRYKLATAASNDFPQKGIERCKKFIDEYPNSVLSEFAWIWLSIHYHNLGKIEKSKEVEKQARLKHPHNLAFGKLKMLKGGK